MEINPMIMSHRIEDFAEKNGYNITDFDDGNDHCKMIFTAVDVDSGEEGCYVGCLMESGVYWVVGCKIDRIVSGYDEMIEYIKFSYLDNS